MPSETAKTASAAGSEVIGLFEQAFRAYGDTVKVAMKTQEDVVKFWSEALGKSKPVHAGAGEWIPVVHKNAEEYLRLLETSYQRNAELMKKMIHSQSGDGRVGMEKRFNDWWQASLEAMRDNAEDMASTNLRVAQAWTEVFKRGV